MGLKELAQPVTGMIGGSITRLSRYSWVLWVVFGFGLMFATFWIWKTKQEKDTQWTHTLIVKRVLENNRCSKPIIYRMRRFPIIKRAEIFELEKP